MASRGQEGSGGYIFHVLNRGNRRMRLFESADDYELFLKIAAETQERAPIRCLSYCLMPNHFHFVLWPVGDGDLSVFMHRLTMRHSKCWHVWRQTTGTGHVYQGRFKAIPVETDGYFLNLCRYVERNPVRAGLVRQAEDWLWSSFAQRLGRIDGIVLSEWPVERPANWAELLTEDNAEQSSQIRHCTKSRIPLGSETWRNAVAAALGLPTTVNRGGRPPKAGESGRWKDVLLPGLEG